MSELPTTDLVTRLRDKAAHFDSFAICAEAAAEIERQRREISRLRELLSRHENPSAHVAAGVTGHD
jgi:hypothetical protein